MVQSGSKRFDFCRKCLNFQPGGLMRALAFMVRSSRITSTAGYSTRIRCTYSRPTGYSFPSLRRSVSAPVLPRARHTHMDWIRILDSGFGLDWITDAFAIHLLSFAIICCHLLSGGGNLLFFIWILWCSSHFGKQKYGSPTPRRAGSRPGLSRNPWELYNQNGTNQQMVYGTLKHDFSP